jgi:hypothetical protein
MRMLAITGVPTSASAAADDDGDRSIGMFLLVLWSASMVVLTWDMAAAGTAGCPTGTTCLGTAFDGIHVAMQVMLFLLAIGTGGMGVRLWLASPRTA